MNKRANEINLNADQFERLKSYYIERYVDNMDIKTMEQYVYDTMEDFYNNLSESDVIDDISFYFEEQFDEIVSEVKRGDL